MSALESLRLSFFSGAGNQFAIASVPRSEGGAGFLERGPEFARALCSNPSARLPPVPSLDGLLLALPPEHPDAAVRMVLFNADGSRPEACGNGLRCIARYARERNDATTDTFDVETDVGTRRVEVVRAGPRGEVTRARVGMGPVHVQAPLVHVDDLPRLETGETTCMLTRVSVGNPHVVLQVDDERAAPVAAWGPALERHPRFPGGVNVGFLASRDGRLYLRVWERGVGETQACGTGACAAAAVARASGGSGWPARLVVPGGELEVGGDPDVDALLTGPVERLGEAELSIDEVLRPKGLESATKSI